MSTNEAKLYQKIMNDKAALAELMKSRDEDERVTVAMGMAERFGLDVTTETLRDFFSSSADDEELSDFELEQVVGGKPDPVINLGTGGNDNIRGGYGNDLLMGGAGDDVINGAPPASFGGDDYIDGGSGNDSITGNHGDDSLIGGTGNDTIYAGGGDDMVLGGTGNDTIRGEYGDDNVLGGTGNDSISGGYGDDVLQGGQGNDQLYGGSGDDALFGGSGNDFLRGGFGNDVLMGGGGSDTFEFTTDGYNNDDVIYDFAYGEDKLSFFGGTGVNSPSDLKVTTEDGNTIIEYGHSSITIMNQELSLAQVWESTK